MRDGLFIAATVLLLASCGQGAPTQKTGSSSNAVQACNKVAPNLAIPAMMRDASISADAMPKLSGGHIAPGVYDLASGEQLDGAPSWEDTRSVSLRVSDAPPGALLEWAELSGPDQKTLVTWNARLDVEPVQLVFTCGRTGTTVVAYSAEGGELHLRLGDPSGKGSLDLAFVPHPQ